MCTMRRFACPRLELLEDRAVPSGGQLDPSFGGDGTVKVLPSFHYPPSTPRYLSSRTAG